MQHEVRLSVDGENISKMTAELELILRETRCKGKVKCTLLPSRRNYLVQVEVHNPEKIEDFTSELGARNIAYSLMVYR